jgi:hypothetical protein
MVLVGVAAVLIGKATPISTEFPNAYIDDDLGRMRCSGDRCTAFSVSPFGAAEGSHHVIEAMDFIAVEALVSDPHPRAERTDSRKSSPAKRMASAAVAK